METTGPGTRTGGVNRMAVVSVACALLAVVGLAFMGMAVLAVFAVGAGHVALHQIDQRGGTGKLAAMSSLALGYAIAAFGLVTSFSLVFSAVAVHP